MTHRTNKGTAFQVPANWPRKDCYTEAPKMCQCGEKLPKPKFGNPYPNISIYDRANEKRWHIPCSCGSILIWSFPAIYKQSHVLELARSMNNVPLS